MTNFNHFHTAINEHFDTAMSEIQAGKKKSHWMWFIFPQLEGLGQSETSKRFAINGLTHAREYLADASLRMAYLTALDAVMDQQIDEGVELATLFGGGVDYHKFKSSVTLFFIAAPRIPLLREAVERNGMCAITLSMLGMFTDNGIYQDLGGGRTGAHGAPVVR